MARDRQSIYLSWGGALGLSEEIWQTGVHLALPASVVGIDDPLQADVDAAAAFIRDFHQEPTNYIGALAYLDWVRASRQSTAAIDMGAPVTSEYTDHQAGGGVGPFVPFQLSCVVSLRSGGTFGTANYGRCYIPQFVSTVGNDGHMNTGNPLALAQGFRILVEGLNGLSWGGGAGHNLKVCNMSAVGAGTTKAVTKIYVGNVFDTQRRRRNALTETYSTQDVA